MSEVAVTSQQDLASKYKSYPEYKDSGVEWLGTIPTHWEMWKLAHAYEVIGSGTTPPTNEEGWFGDGIPWVTTGELREIIIEQTSKCITYEALNVFSALRVHPAGSVVIAMYGATIGRLGILGVNATTNQACCVLTRSIHLDNKYVFYWLQAFRDDIVRLSSGGGQPNINQEKVASLKLSAPDERHQRTISAFLDYETARIDRLIAKQQRLIELLKEKRQAVISHAVTKGLNPDAPMKDSGIEWLGQVPKHWQLTKLKWVAQTTSGSTPNTSEPEKYYDDGEYPWVRTTDLNNGTLIDAPVKITERAIKDTACTLLPIGSVLISMYGGAGSIGKHALLKTLATTNQAVCAVLPNSRLLPEYLNLFAEYYRPFWMASAEGTRKDPNIGQDHIREMFIPVPPLDEQRKVEIYVSGQLCLYDKGQDIAFRQVELLKERRIALISAAVTGKIDLRGWTPPAEKAAA